MAGESKPENGHSPQERHPSWLRQAFAQLRIKITLPYAFLALAVTFAAAFLVTRLLVGLLEDRFGAALQDAGNMAADAVVRVEQEQLAGWRAIAYTDGLAEAVAERDRDGVGLLAIPHLLNNRLDCLEVLDAGGSPLLAMHHRLGGAVTDYDATPGNAYTDWEIVQRVLAEESDEIGDKYADLVETDWGRVFYTAGPIKREGDVVGVLLVGTYLDRLVVQMSAAALAHVSVYGDGGELLATSLAPDDPEVLALGGELYRDVLSTQERQALRRDVEVAGRGYAEVFGAFKARHGHDLGVFSVALPLSFVTDASHPTRGYLLGLFGLAAALVLAIGALVASTVVRRVRRLATAARQVAQGDLSTQVTLPGYDEVASLAQDFNDMVVQLREGRFYRDLLGLTASPEVAERLREGLQEGRLQLEAQSVVATVLFADIRGFTRMSENQDPAYVIRFLNEYLHGLIGIIREYHGIINKFAGDAALAFFGILPEARPPEQSARDGLGAAMAIQRYLKEFNRRREARGETPLRVGIGVNTGLVVVGTLGSEERLEYTIIGDTVNVAQRLSDLNKEYPECDLFIGPETYRLIGDELGDRVVHLRDVRVKGRAKPLDVCAVSEA